jgi:hypothetical protein
MINKYLIKNNWKKTDIGWKDVTLRCFYLLHRHIAVRVQLKRDKTLFYRIQKFFK